MTQAERILRYMAQYGSITPLEAIVDLGCYRLAARIYDLRAEGHDINDEAVKVATRGGGTTTIKRYRLASRLSCSPTVATATDGREPRLF